VTLPTDAAPASSPYERALGSSLHALHPRLRAYFAAIPPGHVGFGRGTFETVGTPRRLLWPILAVLGRLGIAFSVNEVDVPFSIENRPRGSSSVAAIRSFEFPTGVRRMTDAMHVVNGCLIDVLGTGGHVRAKFEAVILNGALELRSSAVGIRVGPMRLRVPDLVAPRVHLIERFDDTSERQYVRVTLDLPMVGRLYEYSGSFTYEVRPEAVA
jgi:hypothetical protein